MKNTYQVKKYLAMAITLTLSAGLLIGCTRSDSSTKNSAAGTGNTDINTSGNVVAGAGNSAPQETVSSETSAAAVSSEAQTVSGTQAETTAQTNAAAQSVSGTTTQTPQSDTSPANSQSTPQTQAAVAEEEEEDGEEGFTGKFVKSDGTEKVQITLENDDLLRFIFKTSMINGTAKVDGTTAVYLGDDNYSITFDVAENILMVTVDGEEAEKSSMNGIYYRDLGEDDTEDEDAAFAADETEDDEEDYFEDEDDTEE